MVKWYAHASHSWQFDGVLLVVQSPSKCLLSGAGDGFVAISAISDANTATLTSRFDFQHDVL